MTSPSDSPHPASPSPPSLPVRLMIAALAAIAFVIAAMLFFTPTSAPGCGAGSGCSSVLSSAWSHVLGIPVTVLAGVIYLDILIAMLVLPRLRLGDDTGEPGVPLRRWSWNVLVGYGFLLPGAAVWFTVIQLVILNELCIYCTVLHGIGIAIGVMLLVAAGRIRPRLPKRDWLRAGVVAAIALFALITLQSVADQPAPTLITDPRERDTTHADADGVNEAGERIVTLGAADLTLRVGEDPILGPRDAEHVLVAFYDYACSHCRRTHHQIKEYQDAHPGRIAMIALPSPISSDCNPHFENISDRFRHSCDTARLALAVWRHAPEKFAEYDAFLFETLFPRGLAEAKAEAARHIGDDLVEQAATDPRLSETIKRNVDALDRAGATRVPLVALPGAAMINEPLATMEDVERLLDQAAKGDAP